MVPFVAAVIMVPIIPRFNTTASASSNVTSI
jgi:hypothetical protein